jgi:putative ABC transport system substrate-binding protein
MVSDTIRESTLSSNRKFSICIWVGLAAVLTLVPYAAVAQQARRPYRIGVLNEARAANHPTVEGLRSGLKDVGLEEGRDVTFDIRFTEGKPEATPVAAAAFVKASVDLIFTIGEASTHAAKEATRKIPILFTQVGDPVGVGIVTKLAQPGGNLTGISSLTLELVPKRLEALKTLAPTLRRVWAIFYAYDSTAIVAGMKAAQAAPRLKLELVSRTVVSSDQLRQILRELRQGDGLLAPAIDTLDIPAVILEASLESRIPAVFPAELWVDQGGLVSYGPDYHAQGVQAARLVARILRGARPQDLPVEGADKIDLTVNLKTVKRLGLTVPRKILIRADKVIR